MSRYKSLYKLFATVVVTLVMASSTAMAEEGDSKINAAWEFQRANRLASAGAITRSIPHYEKVLKAAPDKYPQAYFNLAEVYRFKDMCKKAVLLYQAYARLAPKDESDAAAGVRQCVAGKGKKTGTLSVSAEPEAVTRVRVDGYVVGRSGEVDKLELLPGSYEVEVSADDHIAQRKSVEIEAEKTETIELELEKKLFYGTVDIAVNQKGATIKLTPRQLDSPKASDEVVELSSPMDEPKKLATGKYFLEVTAPDYDRWIRNIYVKEDETTSVDVRLSEALPEAIRAK